MVAQNAFMRAISPFVIVVLAAAIAGSVVVSPSRAQESDSTAAYTHPIVTTALKYQNTWGGQCWTFVRNVVLEATGLTMGFDYHQGFLDAGAWEIPLSEATEGDVIQLADPYNTVPSASYIGLHTVIVMENHGDGTFKVIDSNSNWDEWVTVHDYNPTAAAARYGYITARAYRFPIGNVTPPTQEPGGEIPGGNNGAQGEAILNAVVAADGDCLNLRSGPGTGYTPVTCLPNASVVSVLSTEPVEADGYLWINVQTFAGTGWVAADYLDAASEEEARAVALEHSFVTSLLQENDEPTETPTAPETPAPIVTPTPPPATDAPIYRSYVPGASSW